MAGEERLRLIAEFRDNASAGVRRLGRELGEVRETPGMASASRWMQGFTTNAKAVQQAGSGAGTVMSSLGIGGLAAAGGIAAAVKSFRDLAEQTSSLQAVSRETGVAVTQLKQFQNAAKELHVDPEAMSQGVVHLTDQLALARRGYGELYGMLNQVEPEFMRKIMNEDPTSAMKDVLDRLARIPDDYVRSGRSLADGIAAQKQWTQELLGDQGLNRLVEAGPKALHEALADAAKNTPVVTSQMIAAAEALHKSVVALDTSMEKFQTEAGPFIFKQLTQATNDFREAFKEIEGVVEWVEKHAAHPFKDAANATLDATDAQAAQNSSTEDRATRAGGPRDKMILDLPGVASKVIHGIIGDKALGRGDFAPAADDGDKAARLARMQSELDALDAKLKADKNPIGFPVREADNIARLRELRDAIATMRGDTTVTIPHPNASAPAWRQTVPDAQPHDSDLGLPGFDNPLLHRSAYREDDDRKPARGSVGGMDGGLVLLFREVIASGTKAGFLGAFHEMQGEKPIEGGGGGGLMNASYGGGGDGGGGTDRYRSAGGRGFTGGSPGNYRGGGDGGNFKSAPGKQSMMAKEAYDFWRSKGLDHAHAIGMVVQEQAENNFSNTPGDMVNGQPTAFGSFQFHKDRAALIKKGTGIDVTDPNTSHADMLRAAHYDATKGGRAGFLDRYQRDSSGLDGASDYATKFYEGPKDLAKDQATRRGYAHRWDTNGFPTADVSGSGGASAKGQIRGNLKIGEETFRYGSGGASGSASIPLGDYPINPDSKNPWGRAHNAMDVNNTGSIWDKSLGRMRTGIEMHAASTAEMVTHGCLGFLRDQYPQLKQRIREMIAKNGHAYLHIGENGATITPNREADALDAKREQLTANHVSTLSAAHRLLSWADKASKVDDPSDTPITTIDRRDPRFAPHPGELPRKSLFDAAKGSGIGGEMTHKIEGGATVEIRGLPQSKGTKVKTSGMIEAVNLRRGGLTTQVG